MMWSQFGGVILVWVHDLILVQVCDPSLGASKGVWSDPSLGRVILVRVCELIPIWVCDPS